VARLVVVALLVLCATACSSSDDSQTTGATTQATSPIVVKTPVRDSQWRSPMAVKGTSSLSGKLTAEVLDGSGKQLGSKDTTVSDGRFSVEVPFTAAKLTPGAVLVHDEGSDHSVQIAVVLTP
jgi:hypothetical protein